MAVFAVVVFVVAYGLIVTERIHRVAAALGGAGIMPAAGVVGAEDAFFSQETGVDWNVIFLLLGMMIIVGVLRETGVFEYLAIWAAKRAKGKPFRVMVTFVLLTAAASALLDNVTTVLLVAPVTPLVCLRLGVPPVPFLIAEVLASNIGGAVTCRSTTSWSTWARSWCCCSWCASACAGSCFAKPSPTTRRGWLG